MIKEIEFKEIYPIWSKELWPERNDIRKVSSMTYNKGTYMEVYNYKFSIPKFLAYFNEGKIVGVNSLHLVSKLECRSRGLWVNTEHRGKGIGRKLLEHTIELGKLYNCNYIWSLPRRESLSVYLTAGFEKTSEWINEGVLYGPNCYVCKRYSHL